jgi:hypothetical protein
MSGSTIHPIGDDGFLLVTLSNTPKHTHFLLGDVDNVNQLTDLSELFLRRREPNLSQAKKFRRDATAQLGFAKSAPASTAAYMTQRAAEYVYLAECEDAGGYHEPTTVFCSENGIAVAGFFNRGNVALKVIDVNRRSVLFDSSKKSTDLDDRQLSRPLCISLDGSAIVVRELFEPRTLKLGSRKLNAEFTKLAGAQDNYWSCVSHTGGYIGYGEETLSWYDHEFKCLMERKLPRGIHSSTIVPCKNGSRVAFHGNRGEVWLVEQDAQKPRHFVPHPGSKREALMSLAFSACGRWMASYSEEQIAITDVENGLTQHVGTLKHHRFAEDTSSGHVIRAFVMAAIGFSGSKLLIAEAGKVRAIDYLSMERAGSFVSEQGKPGSRKPIKVKPGQSFEEWMRLARLESYASTIRPYFSPAVLIKSKALKRSGWLLPDIDKGVPLGTSRYGGWPDLPESVQWPFAQSRPMAFIAQINLAEAHAAQPGLQLPKSGLLSFFIGSGAEHFTQGKREQYHLDLEQFAGSPGAGLCVLFNEEINNLRRCVYAKPVFPQLYEPCALTFSAGGLSLPNENSAAYELLMAALPQAARADYNALITQLEPDSEAIHDQLGGYPRLLQYAPPELMCENASLGINPFLLPFEGTPEHSDLMQRAAKWGLLLQLTSNNASGFGWGDAGHFYFYRRRNAHDFSGVQGAFEN